MIGYLVAKFTTGITEAYGGPADGTPLVVFDVGGHSPILLTPELAEEIGRQLAFCAAKARERIAAMGDIDA